MDSRICQRYARALMDLGAEQKLVDAFATDMEIIGHTIHDSPALRSMLHSPVIRPDIKHKVLTEIFSTRISKGSMLFIDLLIKKGRAALLAGVAEAFQNLLDESQGIVNAEITSARELDDKDKAELLATLHSMVKLTIRPHFHVDAAIRGGFLAKVGDTLIDASLQHQLENLREEWKHSIPVHVN